MRSSLRSSVRGTTLLPALAFITICSIGVALSLQRLIPRYRSVYQGASWRESLQAAEAGVNHTVQLLNQFVATSRNTAAYDWTGQGWTYTDSNFKLNGERTLNAAQLPSFGGPNKLAVTSVSLDVYTRQTTAPYHPWFRIRSTGRANLPDRFTSNDSRDNLLRRMRLRTLSGNTPGVTRTVEVIVKPRFRFARAITTVRELSLANSSSWRVDSFDSSDPDKSDPGTLAGGVFPANVADRLSNGGIATLMSLPDSVAYGSLITGNGAVVAGTVETVGGDDPLTVVHENVSGSQNIDQQRIFDTFDEDIPPAQKPVWGSSLALPPGNTGFATGSASAPAKYIVNGNLGPFAILPALTGTMGYVEIIVNGNLDIGSGGGALVVVPPNVFATLYVDGNIDFGNGMVNTDPASSKVATHLTVFGVSASTASTYSASGNGSQALSFYGPNYNVSLNGTVTVSGAMIARTFSIDGGGNGGFHFDEALGNSGDIAGWSVASYFEDTRGN